VNLPRIRSVRRTAVALLLASCVGLVGCGLPEEGRFIALPASDIPDALTATTSTVVTSTTVPPETESSSTTVTEVLYDSVEFYFVSANRVVRSERRIVSPATPTQVLDTLFAGFLSELEPLDQRLAIAQIVLTLTRRPGIGQVLFVVDEVEIQVPRGAGDLTAKGATVTYDDYLSVLSTRD